MQHTYDYSQFLQTISKDQWKRIEAKRRSGIAAPLFSLYSSASIGIGGLADIKLLVDWCNKTGMSIIQLLPMNDVGFNFRPYDAQSTFALDPMYLSIEALKNVDLKLFKNDIKKLRKEFTAGQKRVDYRVKAAKLQLLWKIFDSGVLGSGPVPEEFISQNSFWLEDYCLFKVIKEKNNEMSWEGWSEDLKHKKEETLCAFKEEYSENIQFHKWLQWQLYEQFKKAKGYAADHGVIFMGDLPFLVSRDSADVWAHQDYFKLDLASGAPPDMLYSKGQRWGMPPYNWEKIGTNNFDYLIQKLKYAQNFYDLYRIDHVVGIFRVWTIALSEPLEHGGLNGCFDPKDEALWEEHGRRLLSIMIENSNMLACAEDLGVVPPCSYKVLKSLGIPGIDIQRWMREWDKSYDFKDPADYRINSLATITTHDMSSLCAWWDYEAGTVDEELFWRKCVEKNIPFDDKKDSLFDLKNSRHGRLRWKESISDVKVLLDRLGSDETTAKGIVDLYKGSFDEKKKFIEFLGLEHASGDTYPSLLIKQALEKASESASIFSVQLLHDWLSLDSLFDFDPWELRINFPGTLSEKNWTLVLPISLEDMLELPINEVIKKINHDSGRT
ncbi:MAG TPA: 4-alpha-glucanotransferase [Candidatus Omnitrophica bacterium]|nr:4-alpha-glucanotransferase [Candidatus Omnitrophota bacterium]